MSVTDGYWHKLTRSEALSLRDHYRRGHPMRRLAADFDIAHSTVSMIVRGLTRPVLGLPDISRGPGRPRKVKLDTSTS